MNDPSIEVTFEKIEGPEWIHDAVVEDDVLDDISLGDGRPDSSGFNAPEITIKQGGSSWIKMCMEQFGLERFPESWQKKQPKLQATMSSLLLNDNVWKRYFLARKELECMLLTPHEEVNEKDDWKTQNVWYKEKIQVGLNGLDDSMLTPHTRIRVGGVHLKDELCSSTVVATIFSPFYCLERFEFVIASAMMRIQQIRIRLTLNAHGISNMCLCPIRMTRMTTKTITRTTMLTLCKICGNLI